MPVVGLPVMLECLLNSALQELDLSSFKVNSRGNQTVVILRMSRKITTHTPVTPVQIESASYRKKGPSQIVRDRRRAEVHRATRDEKTNEQCQSPSGLFLPTPPSLFYAADNSQNDVVQDMLCDNNCYLSSTDNRNRQQIDLKRDDKDRQTVTISYGETVSDQACSKDMNEMNECNYVDENEVKDHVCDNVEDYACGDGKDYACDDVNGLKEYACEGSEDCGENDETESESMECTERVSDSGEFQERQVTRKDLYDYMQKMIENLNRPRNKDCSKAVQKENPT